MKVAIGCDHGGIVLKQAVKETLEALGAEVADLGTYTEESVDYPVYGLKVAEAVASGECDAGVLMCGTGIGISIAANKVRGIRCAHCHDTYSATYTRLHNDANMIAFGQKIIGDGLMLEIVDTFLHTEFEGGRHQRRVDKISAIEDKYFK